MAGHDFNPGDFALINRRSPWPERIGLLAVVTDTRGAEHQYPVHGLGKDEIIVHLSEDPLERQPIHMLPNGLPWSCVMPIDALDFFRRGDFDPDDPDQEGKP